MKIVRTFLLFFAIALPINTWLSNIFLILLFVFSGVYLIKSKSKLSVVKLKQKLASSVLPLFLLLFYGLLGTENIDDCFRFFEKSISFLLGPLIFLFFDVSCLKNFKKIFLKGLFFGSAVSMTYLLVAIFYKYFQEKHGLVLGLDLLDYYHTHYNFTKPLDIHPTYLGVYYITVLFFFKEITNKRWVFLSWSSLLMVVMIFMNSRTIFLILILYGILVYGKFLQKTYTLRNYKRIVFSILCIIIIGAGFSVLLSKTYIAHRLKNLVEFELSNSKEKSIDWHNKGNPRLVRWKSALKLLKEKPVVGHGTADEYVMLNEQFKKDQLKYVVDSNYNAHNQFLGYGIRFGILGILVLMNFFAKNITRAFATKNLEYMMMFTSVLLVCFFENFFDRNYGITFSSIFLTLVSFIMVQDNLKMQKS